MSDAKSVCTIVSLVPHQIREEKPGLYPGLFVIPGAKNGDFEVLVIEQGQARMFVGGEMVNVMLPVNADSIARAIVYDYSIAQLEYGDDAGPGLFWVPGKHDKASIIKNFPSELAAAKARQNNWFLKLVRSADDDWNQNHRHKTISNLQRHAAKSLGMEREWIVELKTENVKMCPACYTQVHPMAIICAQCRTILNELEYKKLKRAE